MVGMEEMKEKEIERVGKEYCGVRVIDESFGRAIKGVLMPESEGRGHTYETSLASPHSSWHTLARTSDMCP